MQKYDTAQLQLSSTELYISSIKSWSSYLGCWVNELGNNSKTVEAVTAAVGRSFESIGNMFKHMVNIRYGTYCTLCDSYVLPVANYGTVVCSFANYTAPLPPTCYKIE